MRTLSLVLTILATSVGYANTDCNLSLERIARHSYQRTLLEMTFAQAARGRNDTMRFGSIITDPETRKVLGGSWNRVSQKGETTGFQQSDWIHQLSPLARSFVEAGKLQTGHISLNTSVHAEQGALLEALKVTGRRNAKGLRLHTIGVTPELKIGVATEREWTCMRCAMWIDIFQPQTYELFSNGFRSFGTPADILKTALKNHRAKEEGYWKRVYTEGRKESEPDVYLWLDHKLLLEEALSTALQFTISERLYLHEAYDLARNLPFKQNPMVRLMNFASVLVDPQKIEIVSRGVSQRGLSSETQAIERALKTHGAEKIRGFNLYTIGVDPDGSIALAENSDVTYFAHPEYQSELGIVFHELTPAGFTISDPSTTAKKLGQGRFSPRYWQTLEDSDERVTSPFRYYWLSTTSRTGDKPL